nr:hypothetical protein [Litorivita pollutaquae]
MVHLYRIKVCVVGRSFIKRRVRSISIVENDPVVDGAFGLEPILQFMQRNRLLLEGSPEPFDEDVVQVSAAPIHRDFDFGIGQGGDPDRPGEPGALITVHALRLAVFGNSLVQSFDTEAGIQRARQPP